MRRSVIGIGGFAASLVALAVLLTVFAGPISRALVAATFDVASGYRIAFTSLQVRRDGVTVGALRLDRDGEPVLRADRAIVRYRLRDLFPGGTHRFGLVGFELDRFRITLVRHADGAFNVTPSAVPLPQAPVDAGLARSEPFRVSGTFRDGAIVLDDRFRALPESRRIELGGLWGSVAIDSAARSTYHLRANLAGDAGQPLTLDGRFDDTYATHRVRGTSLGLVPIANYFIDNPGARLESGVARRLDARVYGFAPRPGEPIVYHLAGSAVVAGGGMRIPGLLPSARDMAGRLDFFDSGFATPALTAQIGDLGVRVVGGLLDWQHLSFRLGLTAPHATLAQVRGLFSFSRDLPLEGRATLQTVLEGPVGEPLVATHVVAPALRYDVFPVDRLAARAIYYKSAVEVVGLSGRYGGLDLGANGVVDLGPVVRTQLVLDLAGPAASVPYLAELAPGARTRAQALLTGPGLLFDVRGSVEGGGAGTAIAGLFHIDRRGEGNLGPFEIARADGASVAGTFYLDRLASRSGFWLDVRHAPYAVLARAARLPGIDLVAPQFGGRVDGMLAGAGPPSDFRIAGRIGARALHVGTFALDEVSGDVLGRIGDVRLGRVAARGPWGAFVGSGAYVGDGLALRGDYRGSFSKLAALTGDLGGVGPVAGPIALLVDPRRTIVQTTGVASGGRVLGVPVDTVAGTLAVAGKRVRIYAATGDVAGGIVAAAGTLDGATSLGVSAAHLASARLRAIVPLDGDGPVAAIGAFGRVGKASRFAGGIALGAGSSFDRLPVDGNGDVTFLGHGLQFSATDAEFGPALGTLDGRLGALGTQRFTYDTNVHVAAARLARFVQLARPGEDDVAGTVVGNLRVSGVGGALALAGRIAIPEGSINGLAFRDASVELGARAGATFARDGRVTVGSTQARFAAAAFKTDLALELVAPHANLADFNGYFDAGDTLGGNGSVALRFARRSGFTQTTADVAVAKLTYRRFDLGDASARWHSVGQNVVGAIAFGGASGRLETAGTLRLAPGAPLLSPLEAARFDGTARLRGLDLGVWLPAIGYQVPLQGRVDADAAISGPLRDPTVRTDATLARGSVGAFPVDRFVLSAVSNVRRTTVIKAELDVPAIALSGSGSFGLGDRDPISFGIHAKSPNVGSVAARLAKKLGEGVAGAAELDMRVGGTRAKPKLSGGFDLEEASLRGVSIPRALGQFNVSGRDVVLSSVEVGFATGTLLLAGSLPFEISPFTFGPAAAPIALEVGARGIDLADFSPLLPAGSNVTGKLDGRIAIGGTAGAPRLRGALALGGGRFVSALETQPLTNVSAALSFAGNDARLDSLHAEAGGGSLDATGTATIPDLVRPGPDATYRLDARAKRLRLDLPAYGRGQIDGDVHLAHRPRRGTSFGGNLTLADATIPFAALLVADPGAGSGLAAAPALPVPSRSSGDIALDLTVAAGNNVRVRSSNVDIGGRGELHVGGTTAAPALEGGFDSTGGTLTYVNTVFRLVDGRVSFTPDLGLIPTLDARAITHVSDPDPNTLRNIAGTADVTLDVTGPVTNLAIGLTSDPAYDRQQILGLLLSAPLLGASTLFGTTAGVPTLYGSTTTVGAPPGYTATRTANGQFSVAQEAFGIANAQFTRTLLAPIETSFAQAVGLSNFNVNVDFSGAVGVTARKVLGKKINAIYGTSFGYPYRQTFGFELKPSESTAAVVTVFQTLGATGLTSLTPPSYQGSNLKLQASQPSSGTIGFALSLQRLFK